jgi:hypothetical protein
MKKRILVCDWRPSGFEEVMNEGSGRFVGFSGQSRCPRWRNSFLACRLRARARIGPLKPKITGQTV